MPPRVTPLRNTLLLVLVALLTLAAVVPAQALPAPSKTAAEQTVADRQADLATVGGILEQDAVREALAQRGLTADQVNDRLAELSPQELHSLAQQVDQVQAAGVYVPMWAWIIIAVALVVLIVAVV